MVGSLKTRHRSKGPLLPTEWREVRSPETSLQMVRICLILRRTARFRSSFSRISSHPTRRKHPSTSIKWCFAVTKRKRKHPWKASFFGRGLVVERLRNQLRVKQNNSTGYYKLKPLRVPIQPIQAHLVIQPRISTRKYPKPSAHAPKPPKITQTHSKIIPNIMKPHWTLGTYSESHTKNLPGCIRKARIRRRRRKVRKTMTCRQAVYDRPQLWTRSRRKNTICCTSKYVPSSGDCPLMETDATMLYTDILFKEMWPWKKWGVENRIRWSKKKKNCSLSSACARFNLDQVSQPFRNSQHSQQKGKRS